MSRSNDDALASGLVASFPYLAGPLTRLFCRLVGHRYRNRVPMVFYCYVYCSRCGRVFGSFDAPYARSLWNSDSDARKRMMGIDL